MTDTRPCSCAPDERPYPCQHQYALGLCRKAEIRSLRAELDRCIAQIGDLAKLRSEEEVAHGHVMGRIAIALFGERNNRTDEECVKQAIDVVCERNRLRQHLHDEHQRHVVTMDERDALRERAVELERQRNSLQESLERENKMVIKFGKRYERAEADLAAAQKECDDALAAVDSNWVTHQQIVVLQQDLAAARALLREWRKCDEAGRHPECNAESWRPWRREIAAKVDAALAAAEPVAWELLVDVMSSLAAAISLLERGGKHAKKAAPSDKMFDQMLVDYRGSLERGRSALAGKDEP